MRADVRQPSHRHSNDVYWRTWTTTTDDDVCWRTSPVPPQAMTYIDTHRHTLPIYSVEVFLIGDDAVIHATAIQAAAHRNTPDLS